MGFLWKGPLTVMRLERRGGNTPIGILTAEHHQAAIAAVERYATRLISEPPLTHGSQVPGYHVRGAQPTGMSKMEDLHHRF